MARKTDRRRLPSQARSQERVERILGAASDLIERDGTSNLKMAEVAARAGVPIGSVYQYFPNKSAVIRALAEAFRGRVRQALTEELAGVRSAAIGAAALDRALDRYYELCLDEPVFTDLYWGGQADKALQENDVLDSRQNGRIVYEALESFFPEDELPRLQTTCFLLVHLAGSAAGLATGVARDEGDDIFGQFKRLSRLGFADLQGTPDGERGATHHRARDTP